MNTSALENYILKTADDLLVLGHRHSEWTAFGPVIEEDIAFCSMAQDKVGQAQALYNVLHTTFGYDHPDTLAFLREEGKYTCAQLVELPNGGYDTSLMRHFLFDHAERVRLASLVSCPFEPLANLAKKFKGEVEYHVLHANTWIDQLGNGTEVSKARMQTALDELAPYALGLFEAIEGEQELVEQGVVVSEQDLQAQWQAAIDPILEKAGLAAPDWSSITPVVGGRKGYHSEYLAPLVKEMSEVLVIDTEVEW